GRERWRAEDGKGVAREPAATETAKAAATPPAALMTPLILKRASLSRSSGQWSDDDYDVLENGVKVGRIFNLDAVAPEGRPWMWASGHGGHHIQAGAEERRRPFLPFPAPAPRTRADIFSAPPVSPASWPVRPLK